MEVNDIVSGSISSGKWIKFPDGTYIMFGLLYVAKENTKVDISYTIPLTDVVVCITNWSANKKNVIWDVITSNANFFSASCKLPDLTPVGIGSSANYIAIGRWK